VRVVSARSWMWYLGAGMLAVACYYLVPAAGTGLLARVVVYCLISASAAVAAGIGIAAHRPEYRLPWLLLAASQVIYAGGDTTFYVAHYLLHSSAFPSLADVLYLAHYVPVVVALSLLIRHRSPGRHLPSLLDATALAVVAGLLSWLYLIGPNTRFETGLLVKVTSTGYPLADLVMLVVAVRLFLGPGRRGAAFLLLAGNLLLIMTADTLYALQQLAGDYRPGNYLDLIWLGGNLALGAAALHPAMVQVGRWAPVRESSLGPVRIAVLVVAALVPPVLLATGTAGRGGAQTRLLATVCAVLFLLIILRMVTLARGHQRLAITDVLTGLHSRRFIDAQLELEGARAERAGTPLGVLMIDVDHFKLINDQYGHPVGDRVLVQVARRLMAAARPGDVLGRYGGEEFLLVVPGSCAADLAEIAERVRTQVGGTPIPVGDVTVSVTVSVGAAAWPQHGTGPDELVWLADQALYRAKERGRNQVALSAAAPEQVPAARRLAPHRSRPALVTALAEIADDVDGWLSTHEHSTAVARWSALVAGRMGYRPDLVHRAHLAGRLHDIGKIVIPPEVLGKPDALTPQEWQLLRQHPEHGALLARLVPGYDAVAEIIRQHHERVDGGGYPDRRAGDQIRIEARIVAVCDSWAAMRSARPYQPALSVAQAREQLERGRGGQFDAEVVDVFLELVRDGQLGELRLLRRGPVPAQRSGTDPPVRLAGLGGARPNAATG